MRLTESVIRRIIKEEATRVMREGNPGDGSVSSNTMDPVGLVEKYMTDIEDLFKGGYDPDEAKDEASAMINDLCENLEESMHNWLHDYLSDHEMDRAEYESDRLEDR